MNSDNNRSISDQPIGCKVCLKLSGRKAECNIVEYDVNYDDPNEVWDEWESPLKFCPCCGTKITDVLESLSEGELDDDEGGDDE